MEKTKLCHGNFQVMESTQSTLPTLTDRQVYLKSKDIPPDYGIKQVNGSKLGLNQMMLRGSNGSIFDIETAFQADKQEYRESLFSNALSAEYNNVLLHKDNNNFEEGSFQNKDFDTEASIGKSIFCSNDQANWILLEVVIGRKSDEALEYLCNQTLHQFDLKTTYENKRSILIYSVLRGTLKIAEKIIEISKRTLINLPDIYRRTPLHYAVLFSKLEIIQLLLNKGADINCQDEFGATPLHLAAKKCNSDIYLLLLLHGANPHIKDLGETTAEDYLPENLKKLKMLNLPIHLMKKDTNIGAPEKLDSRLNTPDDKFEEIYDPNTKKESYKTCQSSNGTNLGSLSTKNVQSMKKAAFFAVNSKDLHFFNRRKSFYIKIGVLKTPSQKQPKGYDDKYNKVLDSKFNNKKSQMCMNVKNQKQGENRLNLKQASECILSEASKNYIIHSQIGKGSFGEIFLVSKRSTGSHCHSFLHGDITQDKDVKGGQVKKHGCNEPMLAMKVYSKRKMMSSMYKHFLFLEKKIMMNFFHPFIVKLGATFQTEKKLFMVMEYMEKGDLGTYIKNHGELTEAQARILIGEVILAVEVLHKEKILHRDIKPDNILIGSDGHCKLSDFGLGREIEGMHDMRKTFCGSLCYLPPEVIKKTGHNKSIDWYLIGELLYECIVGKPPFLGNGKKNIISNITEGKIEFPENISVHGRDLISSLLNQNIYERLGGKHDATDLKTHPFFLGIDWNKIYKKQYKLFDPNLVQSIEYNDQKELITEATCKPGDLCNLSFWSFNHE